MVAGNCCRRPSRYCSCLSQWLIYNIGIFNYCMHSADNIKQQEPSSHNIQASLYSIISRVEALEQQNKRLQEQNASLKQEQQRCKDSVEELRSRYEKEMKDLRGQFEAYVKCNDRVVNQIGEKCEVQESKIMSFIDVLQSIKDEGQLGIESRIMQQSRHLLTSGHKIEDLKLPPVTLTPVLINNLGLGSSFYQIELTQHQTSLIYIGESGTWTQLQGRHPITPKKIVQFVFKLVRSTSNAISVGIVDKKYEKLRSCGKKEANCIFYYGGSGRLWEAGKKMDKEGNGFQEGDTVIMVVFLAEGMIRWYVNGRLEAHYSSREFVDGRYRDVEWVPFVNMCTTKDKLIWQVGE